MKILESFEKTIRSIANLGLVIYTNTTYDTERVYTASPKVDLPLGTETTFIVTSSGSDMVSDNEYELLNNYIEFEKSNGDVINIKIIAYNNLTGAITIEQAFGEAITTDTTFTIKILDSLFIEILTRRRLGGKVEFEKRLARFDMTLKTKEDGQSLKSLNYQDLIDTRIGNGIDFPLYADNLTTVEGTMSFQNSPTWGKRSNEGEQIIDYLGSVGGVYYVNNRS